MSAHTTKLMVRPYRPTYAREVEMVPDWIPKAKKYLRDTGTGSLRALFAKLERDGQLHMIAVLNLLGCNIKGQVVKNTKIKADKLVRTKQAADDKSHQRSSAGTPARTRPSR
jgi:hypothetical protein